MATRHKNTTCTVPALDEGLSTVNPVAVQITVNNSSSEHHDPCMHATAEKERPGHEDELVKSGKSGGIKPALGTGKN